MGWRLEPGPLTGPAPATPADIDALNRLFSESFTDRYRRDGLSGMRVPHLNPQVWRYAIDDAGDGALLWRDEKGHLAAFNMVHRSGAEGWMGPLAVRPDRQGHGEGRRIVQEGIDWLRQQGVATIGLETMPRTAENIGFYSALGFLPGFLTVTLVKELEEVRPSDAGRLSRARDRAAALAGCRALTGRLAPGVDYTREQELSERLLLGDTTLVAGAGEVEGFALWHSAPLAEGRPTDELRVLKLVARDLDAFERTVAGVLHAARQEGMHRVAIRAQTADAEPYRRLLLHGWRVHWTDLRMTLEDHPESRAPGEGVVWSNWEI